MWYIISMGDIRILKEQLELGMPLESASILAGYEFEEIDALHEDKEIQGLIAQCDAFLMNKHLMNITMKAEDNPRMSTWLLERRFPQHFSQASKILDAKDIPKSIRLTGVAPGDENS